MTVLHLCISLYNLAVQVSAQDSMDVSFDKYILTLLVVPVYYYALTGSVDPDSGFNFLTSMPHSFSCNHRCDKIFVF